MSRDYFSAGARLSYEERGTGEPVVFLHPTPLDRTYWQPLSRILSERVPEIRAIVPEIRAIVPDLRGHGLSELGNGLPAGGFALVPDAPVLSMAQYADDVIALLDGLGIEKTVFAGCSIGGYILLELWRHIPQKIKAMAFICSKPQPDSAQGQAKRAENIAKARAEGVAGLFDGMAQSLLGATARGRRPEIVAEVRARMTLTQQAVVAVQAGLATRPDSLPTVATIHVPVLAIAGGEDGAVTPAEMEAFKPAPGGCEFHLLEDAGHFAACEQPERVAKIFSAWLRKSVLA